MGDAIGRTFGLAIIVVAIAIGGMMTLALNQNPGLEIGEAFVGSALGLGGAVFGLAAGAFAMIIGLIAAVFAMTIAAMALFLATAPVILILAAPIIVIGLIIWAASRG